MNVAYEVNYGGFQPVDSRILITYPKSRKFILNFDLLLRLEAN